MTVVERREAVKSNGFCFNCLCTAHTRNFCPSRKKCFVCERNHHTMIHADEPSRSGSSRRLSASTTRSPQRVRHNHNSPVRKRQSSPPRRDATVTRSTTSINRSHSHLTDRLSRRSRTHVFLPTAIARILTSQGPEKVRLLLNSGEVQTIIHKALVERLQLHTTKRNNKEYCTVNLQSYYDPSAKIQVVGLVKTQLSISLPKATNYLKLKSVYDHLTELADPHFFQPTNIEILLANDQLPKVLRAGFIQTSSFMPIAQSTIFGWTISGVYQY